ncbi:MAG: DNA cytosine methyltransferase [bacterium]
MFKAISLFSGCGSLEFGFEKTNTDLHREKENEVFDVIWANDINQNAAKSFVYNLKSHLYVNPNKNCENKKSFYYGDIKKIVFPNILNIEEIDLILSNIPYKDFSITDSNPNNFKINRGRLYLEFLRSLIEVQPKVFVARSIEELATHYNGLILEKMIIDIENLQKNWYDMKNIFKNNCSTKNINNYKIVFAQPIKSVGFNIPQEKQELIIIGIRKDLYKKIKNPQEIREILDNGLNKNTGYPITPLEILQGAFLTRVGSNYKNILLKYKDTLSNFSSSLSKEFFNKCKIDICKDYCDIYNIKNKDIKTIKKIHESILKEIGIYNKPINQLKIKDDSNKVIPIQPKIKTYLNHIPPGENFKFLEDTKYKINSRQKDSLRRIHPLSPIKKIQMQEMKGSWGYHYEQEKYLLTNRELARLYTFPDTFLFAGSDRQVRKQIVGSIPPFIAKQLAYNVYFLFEELKKYQ